ncbi:DUF1653 domain-containing protein [Magnetospirillum molischianum]|uniref:DUF1653 domain-containing protein n=1 Tax=Magnetospirillum molischianum DSM 120 TaxID=1150626 RepID=H8FYA0_MAGML|nr:DUF1653 domain-containing protein [Magnetospirillum molischianum]CCG43338.1 conserved hypothetical protein [Magnetospirillum molischianum DSM 120]
MFKLKHRGTGQFVASASEREVHFDNTGKVFKTRNLARQFLGHYGIEDVEIVSASGAQIYRHVATGKLYELVGIGIHTETEEEMVAYRPLYPCEHEMFFRPKTMFFGEAASGRPRFEKVEGP